MIVMVILFVCISLFGPTASPALCAETYVKHIGNVGATVWYQIIAPCEVEVNNWFTIDVKFEVDEDIRAYTFFVWIHGSGINHVETIADDGEIIRAGEFTRSIIVKATETGAVWCSISLGFYDEGDHWYYADADYGVCLIRSKTYSSLYFDYNTLSTAHGELAAEYAVLQSDLNSLSSSYNSLQSNYDLLRSSYDTLDSRYDALKTEVNNLYVYRDLSYLLILTTIVFISTTVYFAKRK